MSLVVGIRKGTRNFVHFSEYSWGAEKQKKSQMGFSNYGRHLVNLVNGCSG